MMDPARFAEIKAKTKAKRAARALTEPNVPEQPLDVFAEVEQDRAEARAIACFGGVDALREILDEVEAEMEAKTARRFYSAKEVMADLDQIVAKENNLG